MSTSELAPVGASSAATPELHLGFDVGGTKIFGVTTDGDGALLTSIRESTPEGARALVETLAEMVSRLAAGCDVASVGVGMAGLIGNDGCVTISPNVTGVEGADIGEQLAQRLGMPVILDNEVNCAARWELAFGAARGILHGLMVAVGTGIGGALILDGEVLRGAAGLAGEPGHMVVEANGRVCNCGRRGCWEMYASGSALDRLAQERLGAAERGPSATAAARQGNAAASDVLVEFAWWLALGISNLCMLTDPELVVIGGGLSTDWDLLADPVGDALAQMLIGRSTATRPRVLASEAGELSAALGAALGGALSARETQSVSETQTPRVSQ
ncbi:ROK family protein [Candidatus Poriferisodalis sp.]|uniref:ROK family protein n=1 Tax=Candidatus Poriferisodalis sp. TaxID=3101277 RepID=UPI003D0D4B00